VRAKELRPRINEPLTRRLRAVAHALDCEPGELVAACISTHLGTLAKWDKEVEMALLACDAADREACLKSEAVALREAKP
jgi:hypothetical protein